VSPIALEADLIFLPSQDRAHVLHLLQHG
jgi:hypothetical protein